MEGMNAMETNHRRGNALVVHEESDEEVTNIEVVREESEAKVAIEERLLGAIRGIGGKPRLETLIYFVILNTKEIID
jgi:hypothetical protein